MEQFNYNEINKRQVAPNMLKSYGIDIEKGGQGSGRKAGDKVKFKIGPVGSTKMSGTYHSPHPDHKDWHYVEAAGSKIKVHKDSFVDSEGKEGSKKSEIKTNSEGTHSVDHKGSTYHSKPGESKEDFSSRAKKAIKDDHKDDVEFKSMTTASTPGKETAKTTKELEKGGEGSGRHESLGFKRYKDALGHKDHSQEKRMAIKESEHHFHNQAEGLSDKELSDVHSKSTHPLQQKTLSQHLMSRAQDKLDKEPATRDGSKGKVQTVDHAKKILLESGKGIEKSTVKMDTKELVDEHKKLVNVLESPSHEDDKEEAKEQKKELKGYEKLKKTFEVLGIDLIEKAEGSRGGKVIGHTKSGKPVYDKAKHEGHKNFTKEDHNDAIDVHEEVRQTRYLKNNNSNDDDKKANDEAYDQQKEHIAAKNHLINKEKKD